MCKENSRPHRFPRISLFSTRRYIRLCGDPRQLLLPLRPLPLSLILTHAPALALEKISAAIATHTGLATAQQGRGAQSTVFWGHILRFMEVRRYAFALDGLITLTEVQAISRGLTPPPRKSTRSNFLTLAELVFRSRDLRSQNLSPPNGSQTLSRERSEPVEGQDSTPTSPRANFLALPEPQVDLKEGIPPPQN